MPSSLLFAGLVATWLAVLVPMAARRRQPMTRPSDAALSSRVLERPDRRNQEGGTMDEAAVSGGRVGVDPGRPPESSPRYRPGRGGYDPEAAALAARARYGFRQRTVLVLVFLAVLSGLVAGALGLPTVWWLHAVADLWLIGYLSYLRRQVRIEHAIRARRMARMTGGRRSAPAAATVADEVARRAHRDHDRDPGVDPAPVAEPTHQRESDPAAEDTDPADAELETPALPPLPPAPLPERPAGTQVLELDDEDPELHELEHYQHWGYRRAAGQ